MGSSTLDASWAGCEPVTSDPGLGLRPRGSTVAGWPSRLRSLRHLSAAVPDLSGARRGDGLAPRAGLPYARGRRRAHRVDADPGPASGSLSGLSRVRDGLSVRGAVRTVARSHAG